MYGMSPPRAFGRGCAPPISCMFGLFWRQCRQNEPNILFFAGASGPRKPPRQDYDPHPREKIVSSCPLCLGNRYNQRTI